MLAGPAGTPADALRRLPVACVVATLGDAGCVARDGERFHLQPAFAVEAVDTTAAGDTFCGALVAALARAEPLPVALREASAASALACTALGAQSSIPPREAVRALLQARDDAPAARAALAALAARCGL